MRLFIHKLAAVGLVLSSSCHALQVTILADTNRDGKVNEADIQGKDSWTSEVGALFLANIGDTGKRCAQKWGRNGGKEVVDQSYLDQCNDASDEIQRNPKYLAPLKTLPIQGLSASAKGSIHVTSKTAASKVRVFVKEGKQWTYVAANHTFTTEELKGGLELGIDARDVRRPKVWDGKADVHFTVEDGSAKAVDSVAFRVAPVLAHHHLQHTERVFSSADVYNKSSQAKFISDLQDNVSKAGIKEPVYLFTQGDIWTQDFFEPAYTSIPGPDGLIVLRIMIRSAQMYRIAGRDVFHELLNDKVGAVQSPGAGDSLDATGNLETIPPYEHNGKKYPAGRIIMGEWEGRKPEIFEFLQAQEVQDPIALDTAWLNIGHVDEFLQFLPADNERGWVLMADDPLAGLNILKEASANGHGSKKALSRPRMESDRADQCLPEQTINEVLNITQFEDINKSSAKRIEANLEILKRETGITDEDIIRVPATYYYATRSTWDCVTVDSTSPSNPEETPRSNVRSLSVREPLTGGPASKPMSIIEASTPDDNTLHRRAINASEQVVAFYPGTINGVVLTNSLVLAPNPWGPVIDGEDIYAKAVSVAYAKAGFNVTYQDDWFSHHKMMGEIHCGTNTWRTTDPKWW